VDVFGGKAAHRGDKLARATFDHILARRCVAQAIAPTSFRRVSSADDVEVDLVPMSATAPCTTLSGCVQRACIAGRPRIAGPPVVASRRC